MISSLESFILHTLHVDDLSDHVGGVDCSWTVFDAANIGLCGGTVAVDVSVGGELNDTAAKGSDTVGLCAEEEYPVGILAIVAVWVAVGMLGGGVDLLGCLGCRTCWNVNETTQRGREGYH